MYKVTDPTSSLTQYRTESAPFRSPSPELLDPAVSLNSFTVDPREEELESFLYAARHGDIETILTLLESYYSGSQLSLNATSNNKSHGWTALHWATYMGHDNIVELLLKNGASPNVQNDQGDTPLHKAAYTNRCSTVSLLLNYNCDVSLKNSLGKNAILFCENGDVREMLIGAARSQDKQKEFLLLDVAKRGDLRSIQDLVDSPDPPSINCIDEDGNTALHIASYRGHAHLIIYLMHHGINIHLKNTNNQTAADLAKNSKTRQLLKVEPLQTSVESLQTFQGPLLKRYLLTKYKLVWVVINNGYIEIYPYKDKMAGVMRRNLISKKELTNCHITESSRDTQSFRIIYDSDPDDIFRIPTTVNYNLDVTSSVKCEITREMWEHAIRSHTDYLNKRSPIVIINPSEMDVNGNEVRPKVNSLSEGIRIAEAHMSLFQKHVTGLHAAAQVINTDTQPELSNLVRQLHDTLTLAMQTKTQLTNCMTNLHQQEDISQLLAHEVEKNRILEESLNILASENQSLQKICRSTSVLTADSRTQFIGGPSYHSSFAMTTADQFEDALTNVSFDSDTGFPLDEEFNPIPAEKSTELFPMLDLAINNNLLDKVKYRNALPAAAPVIDFSVWAILKNCIGKDLSRISMPVFLNEPLSMLQRVAESLDKTIFFRKILECEDPLVRIQMIAGKLILAQISQIYRFKKPFNPVLGETFEFVDDGSLKIKFVAEQVSHHPPIGAFNCKGDGFETQGTLHAKVSFWGKSIEISPLGGVCIRLDNGDVYTANNVTTIVHNIIVGKMWMEKYGVMEVINHSTKDRCILNFKPAGWFGKDLHWVDGCVLDSEKRRRYIVQGKWPNELWSYPADEVIGEMNGSSLARGGVLIYKCPTEPGKEENYFFSKLAMNLNHLLPEMEGKLPHTDSRFRNDIRSLEEGDINGAGTHKHRIEEKQREQRRAREERNTKWKPLWFEQRESPYTHKLEWAFTGKYWERDFSKSPNIF